jgi:hypothetical protein
MRALFRNMEVVQHLYTKIMREICKHVTERLAGWRPVCAVGAICRRDYYPVSITGNGIYLD